MLQGNKCCFYIASVREVSATIASFCTCQKPPAEGTSHQVLYTTAKMSKKVAIVGSGCSGIGALWALKNTQHDVHLFEADSRLGGHTNTVHFKGQNGDVTPVDAGFIVMNTATYPNFLRFLQQVGIQTRKTEMSFGVSRDYGDFEWAGRSLRAVFANDWSFMSPRRWRLIFDIVRFNQFALDVIIHEDESEQDPLAGTGRPQAHNYRQLSIGEYLEREGYSQTFKDDYLIPMTAMVWSTAPDKASLHFPALTLIRFMWNHHLLNTITERPDWLTIPGGTRQYLDAVMKDFPKDKVHLRTKVTAVVPETKERVMLRTESDDLLFDHVILATHGDTALDLLKPVATKQELDILDGFRTNHNIAVLHSDLSLMPKRKPTWSAWNFITESPFPPTKTLNVSKVCLTYCMNMLQHIPDQYGPVLVTLNPLHPPKTELTQGIWEYSHPVYDAKAIRSQKLLPNIQNKRGVSFCGAWTKYGFHEDGFSSGLAAAQNHLGVELPFEFVDSTFSRGQKPVLTLKNHAVRVLIQLIQLYVVLGGFIWDTLTERLNLDGVKSKKL